MKNQEKIIASLTLIADRNLGIETLDEQSPGGVVNDLNFRKIYIPELKIALQEAYSQGVIDAKAVVLETISELKTDMGL